MAFLLKTFHLMTLASKRSYLIALSALALFLTSCRNEPVFTGFNGFTQGTTYSIIFEDNGSITSEELKTETQKILENFDLSLSLYRDSSIVSKVNRNEDVVADEYFTKVYHLSEQVFNLTGGSFDITIGPLVKAWGFGPDARKSFSEGKRDSLLKLVGMEKISLIDGRIMKENPAINLDFNAIAQGYAVDVISKYLSGRGIKRHLVEIGGEVRVTGDKAGNKWRIGIDRPAEGNLIPGSDLQAVITMTDRSLATSGNYRKFYEENGVKYSHTIDPVAGYPVRSRLLSATILADECALADGVATACMVMGLERAIAFIENHKEFDAFFIYSDTAGAYLSWISEGLKENITESDSF